MVFILPFTKIILHCQNLISVICNIKYSGAGTKTTVTSWAP